MPALLFALGTFWYLVRRGRSFDLVDCASFPFLSLLAARLALTLGRSKAILVSEWHECWTRSYWVKYLGAVTGNIGYRVQSLCVRSTTDALTFSQFVTNRLKGEGFRGRIEQLPGLYGGPEKSGVASARSDPPEVVFVGRHIPEKRASAIPAAIARARAEIPDLRSTIFGDGPERPLVLKEVEKLELEEIVECPGFVEREVIDDHMCRALCLLLPSEREGYGIVLVESAAFGTPVVVTRSEESAATELVHSGENGYVTESADPEALATAIVRVYRDGQELRRSTASWFNRNAGRLSAHRSAELVEELFLSRTRL